MTESYLDAYASIEASLPVHSDETLADLVVPKGNELVPFHRWFRVKEAFSWRLLPRLVDDLDLARRPSLVVLDPFCGAGTTVISAVDLLAASTFDAVTAVGLEINPFLNLVSRTKAHAAAGRTKKVRTALTAIADRARAKRGGVSGLPALSTFARSDYFPLAQREALASLATTVAESSRATARQRFISDLASVALGSIVEPASHLRRDGRTMRYNPDRIIDDPFALFDKAVDVIATDIEQVDATDAQVRVNRLDGRRSGEFSLGLDEGCHLILFSPPYPNNIDYTEVYKLEAWLTGSYSSAAEFAAQRRRTLRSHPSVRFNSDYGLLERHAHPRLAHAVAALLNALPDDRYLRQRERLVSGYVDDMLRTFMSLRPLLREDGFLAYVVANSLHGRGDQAVLIAADLLLADAAQCAGFVVEDFRIARRLSRRSQAERLSRESLVVLRPT